MTRATLYAVTDDEVISSTEFNGDGYPSGYGIFYIELLEKTKSGNDFINMVNHFNQATFCYRDKIIYHEKRSKYIKKNFVSMGKGCEYFDNWSSDWIFIKNISSKPLGVVTREGYIKMVNPHEQIALNFGYGEGCFKSKEECKKKHNLTDECGAVSKECKEVIFSRCNESETVTVNKKNK